LKEYILIVLKVRKIYQFDSAYGISSIITMKDENGNFFTWKTSDIDWEEGQDVKVKGTVVKHEEYKGVKTTYISRCKVLENA